jgi:hypothetical protein
MALQPAKKQAENDVPVTKKRGRPSTKKRIEFDYSKHRQRIYATDDFARYLAGYPDKSGLMAYFYRLHPKIDFALIGRSENNILETAKLEEMTPTFIAEKFGRGDYMLTLNDANRQKGEYEVCRTWFKLGDELRPPVYDYRTLQLAHPANTDEVNRLMTAGIVTRDASGVPRLRNEADAAAEAASAAAPAVVNGAGGLIGGDMLGRVVMGLLDRAIASPRDVVRDSIEVARLITPPAQPAVDVESVVEKVVQRLGGVGRPGLEGDLETYDRVSKMLDRFRPAAAAAVAGVVESNGAAGWQPSQLNELLANLRGIIPEVVSAFQMFRPRPASGQQQQGDTVQMLPIEKRIEEIFTLGFVRMNEGVKGFDFAAWVCNYYPGGLEVYRQLEARGGAVGCLALLAMNPQGRTIANDPQLRPLIEAFLTDFFTYSHEPVDASDEEETAAGAAGGV